MDGSWVEWPIPSGVNAVLVQNRSEVATQISMESAGTPYFTLRSKNAMALGSFNTNEQSLFLKATGGSVVEIATTHLP
jgi:uncharacterized membrane protein